MTGFEKGLRFLVLLGLTGGITGVLVGYTAADWMGRAADKALAHF